MEKSLQLGCILLAIAWTSGCNSQKIAQNQPSPPRLMDNQGLEALIKKIDDEAQGRTGYWSVTFQGHQAQVITDETADRMRVIAPVTSAEELDQETLYRVMQANFGTALDARYCVAKGILWAAFIHPLQTLTDEQFLSGLQQTINLVKTYGKTYSGGPLQFKGGDGGQEKNDPQIKAREDFI